MWQRANKLIIPAQSQLEFARDTLRSVFALMSCTDVYRCRRAEIPMSKYGQLKF